MLLSPETALRAAMPATNMPAGDNAERPNL